LRRDKEIHSFISATISTQLAFMRSHRNMCKLKHAQTCLYYDQVAWFPLNSGKVSLQEFSRPTTYVNYGEEII